MTTATVRRGAGRPRGSGSWMADQVSVGLTQQQLDFVRRKALARNVPMAQVVREALAEYIARQSLHATSN